MDSKDKKIGYIYKITTPSDKVYIGQTINLIKRKSDYNKKRFSNQIKLWNYCEAHSWNPGDSFEVIEECLCGENRSNINEREKYWVAFYDSHHNGLNCDDGGGGRTGFKHSEETKERLRQINLGKKLSEETKEKCRIANVGNTYGTRAKGKKLSEETKKKLSESVKAYWKKKNCQK